MFRSFSYNNQTNLRGEASVTFNLVCIKSKTKYLTCIKLAYFLNPLKLSVGEIKTEQKPTYTNSLKFTSLYRKSKLYKKQ